MNIMILEKQSNSKYTKTKALIVEFNSKGAITNYGASSLGGNMV